MDVSGGLLALGLTITIIGVLMVYLSLRADPSETQSRGIGVVFIGPIPLVLGGSGRLVLIALGIGATILLLIMIGSAEPNLIGW
jgi:uncharacterized membrane protein